MARCLDMRIGNPQCRLNVTAYQSVIVPSIRHSLSDSMHIWICHSQDMSPGSPGKEASPCCAKDRL